MPNVNQGNTVNSLNVLLFSIYFSATHPALIGNRAADAQPERDVGRDLLGRRRPATHNGPASPRGRIDPDSGLKPPISPAAMGPGWH